MGTRADFYIGRGVDAEWLGSIAWDGYPSGIDKTLLRAKSDEGYRAALGEFFDGREDVTLPAAGWPWPWDDSSTTDYAYAFDGGKVWASSFGHKWFIATRKEPDGDTPQGAVFPKFSQERMAPTGSKKSGVILIGF